MKTLILSIAFLISSFSMIAQSNGESTSEGTTITITVPVQSNEGNVVVGLYQEANFMKNPSVGSESDIVDGKATVTFDNVAPGTYAVILFHDKNLNKQMDFDPSGMPLEMYGVSNNVMSMGPPQWNDTKFEVTETPINMEIRM